MCTLILAHRPDTEYPLVVGANRDESYHRPSRPPELVERAGMRMVAPRDEVAGGTWLGWNEAGVFAGITNRFGPPTDPDRRSRGELVFRALEEATAAEAAQAIGELEAADYNAFHLLIADAETAQVVISDGELLTTSRRRPGLTVITERSFGAADNQRKYRARRMVREAMKRGALDPTTLQALLSERDSESIDAICVTLPGIDYGTRSSTILRVDRQGRPEMWHAEGPPFETAFEDYTEMVRELHGG